MYCEFGGKTIRTRDEAIQAIREQGLDGDILLKFLLQDDVAEEYKRFRLDAERAQEQIGTMSATLNQLNKTIQSMERHRGRVTKDEFQSYVDQLQEAMDSCEYSEDGSSALDGWF